MEEPPEERCPEAQHDQTRRLAAREALLDDATAEHLARIFRAMADPTRVRILSLLNEEELCVGDLADALEMTLSAISHQLRLLRKLRVVRRRRDGRHIYYSLDDDHIRDLFRRGLEHVQHD